MVLSSFSLNEMSYFDCDVQEQLSYSLSTYKARIDLIITVIFYFTYGVEPDNLDTVDYQMNFTVHGTNTVHYSRENFMNLIDKRCHGLYVDDFFQMILILMNQFYTDAVEYAKKKFAIYTT